MSKAEGVTRMSLKEYGRLLVTRDQGEPVRECLLRLLEEYDVVEIDLDGVEAYTPSFLDEVLGKCLEQIGAARFRRQVKLAAGEAEVRKLANVVLSNRAARTH